MATSPLNLILLTVKNKKNKKIDKFVYKTWCVRKRRNVVNLFPEVLWPAVPRPRGLNKYFPMQITKFYYFFLTKYSAKITRFWRRIFWYTVLDKLSFRFSLFLFLVQSFVINLYFSCSDQRKIFLLSFLKIFFAAGVGFHLYSEFFYFITLQDYCGWCRIRTNEPPHLSSLYVY